MTQFDLATWNWNTGTFGDVNDHLLVLCSSCSGTKHTVSFFYIVSAFVPQYSFELTRQIFWLDLDKTKLN